MICFKDILKKSVKDKSQLVIVSILAASLAFIQITRSFVVGKIIKTLNMKYVLIFVIVTSLSYIIAVLNYRQIYKETLSYGTNFFNTFIETFFSADFKKITSKNESLLSEFNESLDNLHYFSDTFYSVYINKIIMILTTTIIFLYNSPKVGLAIIGAFIFIFIIYKYISNIISTNWENYSKSLTDFNKQFQNIMLNIWNIKYNSLEMLVNTRLRDSFNERQRKYKKYLDSKIWLLEGPGFVFFLVVIYNLITIVKTPSFDVAMRVFLILQLFKVWKDFYICCITSVQLYTNANYVEKICPVWMLDSKEDSSNICISDIQSIEFKNVSFSYNTSGVINKLNFKINKGETVSLSGRSGSGKSTVINLICRLYDVNDEESKVLINGTNIKNITIESLRKEIGVVPQTVLMFNNTIRYNVILDQKYNNNRFNELKDLLDLPDENTNAKALSYGQKQRVLIARTLYNKDKSVYIFDEYLSAVDEMTANKINKYVLDFIKKKNKIGIFISHNEDRKKYADKIIQIS